MHHWRRPPIRTEPASLSSLRTSRGLSRLSVSVRSTRSALLGKTKKHCVVRLRPKNREWALRAQLEDITTILQQQRADFLI